MNNETSILTDLELDAVTGGSLFSAMTAAVAHGAGGGRGQVYSNALKKCDDVISGQQQKIG